MKCEFKIVFNDNHYCFYLTSELHSNKTMWYWYKFLENVISDFKDSGYNCNNIAEKKIITIAKNWICHLLSILNILCVLMSGN